MLNTIKQLFDKKLLKFFLIGVFNSIIRAGGMFILYNCFKVSYWISSLSNYIIGGFISFFLNKYFTFGDKTKSFKQFIYFIINLICCYILGYVITKWAIYKICVNSTEVFKDNLAMVLGFCIYSVVNYVVQRLLIFKNCDIEIIEHKKNVD